MNLFSKVVAVLTGLIMGTGPLFAVDSLTFSMRGDTAPRTFTFQEISKLVPAEKVTVIEPHTGEEMTFEGFPVAPLLEKMFKGAPAKFDEILFTCLDGYQPSIPLADLKGRKAWLVFRAEGMSEFKIVNKLQGNKSVALGPYYLIWDNKKDAELMAEGANSWPYQVKALELINFGDHFPRMAPAAHASKNVKDGFVWYRKHCLSCHTLNGEGGAATNIELNYPLSVTEYFKEGFLKQWIDDPSKVRFDAGMPPFTRSIKNRAQRIDGIIAYLKHMASRKQAPKEKPSAN